MIEMNGHFDNTEWNIMIGLAKKYIASFYWSLMFAGV